MGYVGFASRLRAGLLFVYLVGATPLVHSATCVWTGAGANGLWSTAANWNNCGGAHPVPIDGDSVEFPAGAARLSTSNDLVDLDLAQMRLNAPFYSISGNPITLAAGIAVDAAAGARVSTFLPITLKASQTFGCSTTNSLTIFGTLSLAEFDLVFDGCEFASLGGAISGTGSLTKRGAGTLRLGTSTHSGATIVDDGVLEVVSDGALGAEGDMVVNAGATLALDNISSVITKPLFLSGSGFENSGALRHRSGSARWAGPVVLIADATIDVSGIGETLRVSGSVQGNAGLMKAGPGTLILSGANTYQGRTEVAQGALQASSNTALGPGNVTSVSSGASLELPGVVIDGEALVVAGSGGLSGARSVHSVVGTSIWNGPVELVGSPVFAAFGTLSINGPVSGASLTKSGFGRLVLAGTNSYGGTTSVLQGTLRITSSQALGGSGGPTVLSGNSTIEIEGPLDITESLQLGGAGFGAAGALRSLLGNSIWRGPVQFTSPTVVNSDASSTITLAGDVGVASFGTGGLTKIGTGTLVLSGANTYTGPTALNAGTLRIESNTALGATVDGTVVVAGTTLELQGGITTGEALTLNGNGTGGGVAAAMRSRGGVNVAAGDVNLASATSIDVESAILTLAGSLNGSSGLTKIGTGTLALAGSAGSSGTTYTGTTTISQGVLQVQGATGPIVVANDGQLTGNGTAGPVTLLGGGVVAPTGTLSAESLTWHGGGTLEFSLGSIGAGADRLQLTGALLRGAGSGFQFRFTDAATGGPMPAVPYVLATYASTSFESNNFTHTYYGVPSESSLRGAFFVTPDQLVFEALSVASFVDGFE